MNEIIVSIPYSGTRFVEKHLNISLRVHCKNRPYHELLQLIGTKTIVAPIRSPLANWLSTVKREGEPTMQKIAEWYDAWYMLNSLFVSRPVHLICIEDQNDRCIDDWQPVGHIEKPVVNYPVPPMNFIYQLPVVQRFYTLKQDKQLWWTEDMRWMT